MKNKKVSPEVKIEALKQAAMGVPVAKIAKQYGFHESLIGHWKRKGVEAEIKSGMQNYEEISRRWGVNVGKVKLWAGINGKNTAQQKKTAQKVKKLVPMRTTLIDSSAGTLDRLIKETPRLILDVKVIIKLYDHAILSDDQAVGALTWAFGRENVDPVK